MTSIWLIICFELYPTILKCTLLLMTSWVKKEFTYLIQFALVGKLQLLACLFTYYEYSTCFEPATPQYKKLRHVEIVSLTLKIMDQAGKVITDGPGTTVVLHIQ